MANSDLFHLEKVAFRAIQSNPPFDRSLIHSCGSFMIKKVNILNRFCFRKWPLSAKRAKFDLWPLKNTLRTIQPNPSLDSWSMTSQRSSMPKKTKSYWSVFFRNWHFQGKVDADGRTMDEQVGIKIAPLPSGTVELKELLKFFSEIGTSKE